MSHCFVTKRSLGTALIISGMALLFSSLAFAAGEGDSKPPFSYSFGGSCASQGYWTKTVLTQSDRIKDVVTGIMNNPECQTMKSELQGYLDKLASLKATATQADGNEQSLGSVRKSRDEVMAALRYLTSGSIRTGDVANVAASSGARFAAGAAVVGADLVKRTGEATGTAIELVRNVQKGILANQRCFGKDVQKQGQVFASSVHILSAFVDSGQASQGANLAGLINDLTAFAQDLKLNSAIAKIDEVQYMNSVRCMIETAQENYCQIIDANELLKASAKMVNDTAQPAASVQGRTDPKLLEKVGNPMAGIYALTTYMPVITNYIQRLLLGVKPSTPEEATFQTNTLKDINDFQVQVKDLQGLFAKEIRTINGIADNDAKANRIVKFVQNLTDTIVSDRDGQNFFTGMALQPQEIPFMLLGIEKSNYPNEVFNPVAAGLASPMRWVSYFETYAPKRAGIFGILNSPSELTKVIEQQLAALVESATIRANEYYGGWFLADPSGLIDESIVRGNFRFSFVESLEGVRDYIVTLEKRQKALGRETLPSMYDAKVRINRILGAISLYRNEFSEARVNQDSAQLEKATRAFKEKKQRDLADLAKEIADLEAKGQAADGSADYLEQMLSQTVKIARMSSCAGGGESECPRSQEEIDLLTVSNLKEFPAERTKFAKKFWLQKVNMTKAQINLVENQVAPQSNLDVQRLALSTMTSIYLELNILLSRSTFLPNRMETWVTLDYDSMLRHGVEFSDYQKQLMIALGPQLLPDLRDQIEKPWAQVVSDLQTAANVASENFNRVEEVFRNPFIKYTRRLSVIKDNSEPGALSFWWKSFKTNAESGFWAGAEKSYLLAPFYSLGYMGVNSTFQSDRYDWGGSWFSDLIGTSVRTTDTGSGAAEYLWNQLCVQGLAFNNYADLPEICRTSVLRSAVELVGMNAQDLGMDTAEAERLKIDYNQRQRERKISEFKAKTEGMALRSRDRDRRICTLRNYYRDNYVFQLSVGMRKKAASNY